MKKKVTIYILLVVVAVLAILIITKHLPPVSGKETSGTIGKVDKYRKVQMTEKDIILRSEFVKDTSALAKSIQGLLLFNSFAKEYAVQLKSWTGDLEKSDPSSPSVKALNDYSTFLNNNVPAVENTIGVLLEFYKGDTTEISLDVDKKLADFYSFAYNFFMKDSAVNRLIPELEKKISQNLALKDKKDEEVKRLKEIHDQMLLKTLQVSLLAGDKKSVKSALQGTLYSSSNLQGLTLSSKTDLQNTTLGIFMNESKLGLFSQSGLNSAMFSQVNLNVFMAEDKLGSAQSQQNLNAINSQEKLGDYMAQGKLGPIAFATVNLGNSILSNASTFGNVALGAIAFSNSAQLQNFIQSNIGSQLSSQLGNTTLMNMDKLGSF